MTVPVVGAVLMGGRSRRFGSDKALADANGTPMGLRVAQAMREAGLDPVVAAGGEAGSELGLVTIPDRSPGNGPLAALASLLSWANAGGVVVAPCDLPFVQPTDISKIVESWLAHPDKAVCAAVNGEPSVMLACWPATAARRLQQAVDSGSTRFRDGLEVVGHRCVEVDPLSVADADDPASLEVLLSRTTPDAGIG